jgi:hypothetical protein
LCIVSTCGLNKSKCLCINVEAFPQMGLWIASHGTIIADLMLLPDAGWAVVTCRFIKFVLKLFDVLIATIKNAVWQTIDLGVTVHQGWKNMLRCETSGSQSSWGLL